MECLPIAGEKQNIISMCTVQLMVPILILSEYTRNLCGPVFENVSISPVHCMVKGIMFYFIAI
jgi:hypothetical protein